MGDPSNPLTPGDLAEIEALYQKITTPLPCRLRLHHWSPWKRIFGIQYATFKANTGKQSDTSQIDVQMRMCDRCGKPQARAVPAKKLDQLPDGAWTVDEDDDE